MPNLRLRMALAAAIWVGLTAGASAQNPGGRYQPAQPTISPWMGLYSRNTGALDNYHTFVRPTQELRTTIQQQNTQTQQNHDVLQNLRTQVHDLAQPPMRSTGAGSVFMDYSHYFGQPIGPGASRTAGVRTVAPRPRPNTGH